MYSDNQTLMFAEAKEASAAVARTLDRNRATISSISREIHSRGVDIFVTNARGSSDHACVLGKYALMRTLGAIVSSGAPSISSVYHQSPQAKRALMISVSQSGHSPDIVSAAKAFREGGGLTLAIVNQENSPLAQASDFVLPLHAGPELSVAATKSYICSAATLLALTAELSNAQPLKSELEDLPVLLSKAWSIDWTEQLCEIGHARSLFAIGRGGALGAANEIALKFKETCQIHAESFSSAECSHGPLAMLGLNFPAIVLCQNDASRSGTLSLVDRMLRLNAPVYLAGAYREGAISLPSISATPELEPILMVQSFYRAVSNLAIHLGLNPDDPPALKKVTETT